MVQSRAEGWNREKKNELIGLPYRPFLYTLDQISVMLDVTVQTIRQQYIYFEGRTIGSRSKALMVARNIAVGPRMHESPDWRVAEREFIRWMRFKGYRYYERSVTTD